MSAQFYSQLKGIADIMIAKFGSPVKVTRANVLIGTGYGIWTNSKTTLDTAEQFQMAVTTVQPTTQALCYKLEVTYG